MTPCPCLQSPSSRSCPLWMSPPLVCSTAAASGSPLSLSTSSCQQRRRISRGIFLIRSCLEARMLGTSSSNLFIRFPPLSSVQTLQWDILPSVQFVSYRLYSAPHRLLWLGTRLPSRPANRTVVLDDQVGQRAHKRVNLSCSCWIKSHIMLKRGEILQKCRYAQLCINVADVSSLPLSSCNVTLTRPC